MPQYVHRGYYSDFRIMISQSSITQGRRWLLAYYFTELDFCVHFLVSVDQILILPVIVDENKPLIQSAQSGLRNIGAVVVDITVCNPFFENGW